MPNPKHVASILRLNLALAFAEGLLVLGSYLREPSEPDSAVFLGFSYSRLTLILLVLVFLSAMAVLLLRSFRNGQIDETFLVKLANRKGVMWIPILWLVIVYGLLFLSDHQLGSLASYRERLLPIILWLALLAIQFIFFVIYIRGIRPDAFREQRSILIPSLIVFILLGGMILFIKLTGIGLKPDPVYWQAPGVPLLLPQVFVAALAGILFYQFIGRTNFIRPSRVNLFVFLVLWGLACLIWLHQPTKLTHFSLEPTAPNYQIYPFSDSLLYDHTAREYLIGKPIPSDFWTKPVYSFFLAILHGFAGGNYTLLTALQVIVLAIIPGLAYLLMARLGNRPAGLSLGLLLILRERNALALSNVIQVSHVKLLLSDVFVMGGMVLLLWLFFHWLEKPGERRVTPLILGGVFSLIVLTRGHPILLLPVLLGAVLLARFPQPRLRWEAAALLLLGFILPLLPWLWRNYQLTGTLAFQYPVSPYSAQMSSAYSFEPSTFDLEKLPPRYSGEPDFQYYNRLQGQAVRFAFEHPMEVMKFVSAHYFHNLLFSYIYLPHSFQVEDVKNYVDNESFWNNWQGTLSFQAQILLLINLGVLALGFGFMWKKYKYLALVPVLLGMAYNLSISVGRVSGWRFILPADWITLIYYAIGLMQLYDLLKVFLHQKESLAHQEETPGHDVLPFKRLPMTGFALFFLILSVALTKGQILFSQRYPDRSVSQLKEDYSWVSSTIPLALPRSALDELLDRDGLLIVYGQAQNPSFRVADEEELDSSSWPVFYFWPSYKPQPFPRVIFNLSGPRSAGIVLPMESPPASFPDGVDVIVIGCLAESGEINALAVLIQGDAPIHYISEPFPSSTCPVPAP